MGNIDIFTQLSIVIVLVTIVATLVKVLRQPLILGYILTGLIIGPSLLHILPQSATFETFSNIGITLLLFIVGLGLNVATIRKHGKVVTLTALAELVVVGTIGFFVTNLMGFTFMEAILIGLCLFFSSTIIIVKVLSDKKEQNRLHGQIAIGVILLDDIVATIALLFVAAGKGGFGMSELGFLIIKGVILAAILIFVSTKILPKLSRYFAGSQELLFLFTIAWGFGIATLFKLTGFSIEVGALFAGVSLAGLPYAQEMASRLKPLRNFFVMLFFISLGGSLNVANLAAGIVPAIVLSLVVIILKPLAVMTSLGLFGYTKRTSFMAGINLSQISEFSIILIVLAQTNGLVSPGLSAIVTLVAIITITTSSYLMHFDNAIFTKFKNKFAFFEDRINQDEKKTITNYKLLLFGYKKGGHEFIKAFRQMHKKYIVVDYNPEVIELLEQQHIPFMYGDAADYELLDEIGIAKANLVVSTITDFGTNTLLIKHLHRVNPKAVFICHADNYEQAVELYRHGVTYVMLPHYIGSERISAFIRRNGTSKEAFDDYRQKHLLSLGRIGRAALH
ncbi:MAG TPA: cation:proton antiporter [Candidatus Saccharimonadales bacterium]|jgi:Kef-type K+ transport system membrane component KefB/voltage-gated potassium channel Kch|nr:cation:proton antiporter [Candidatus Saccharimonadales bacterium]